MMKFSIIPKLNFFYHSLLFNRINTTRKNFTHLLEIDVLNRLSLCTIILKIDFLFKYIMLKRSTTLFDLLLNSSFGAME
ncbi:hypothetical protein BpHYR1_005226 [Brachionus plicatilis]|uniref:Uncharacterized protein n=1 Tax=Brachionus plicatilis TaxID=10195 RepID=A0A3M7RFY2_BRAPC|nr:hypothetical protein BpHYR1_005226 [Brachionus plicatilis]